MDETRIGGKARNADKRQWDSLPTKTARYQAAQHWADKKRSMVFGMVERGGKVSAHVVPSRRKGTLLRHIETRVTPGSTVYTDELKSYVHLRDHGYEHAAVNHKAAVWVDGDVHTQTIEGFWSLVKRGIDGTHHAVSRKHLQGYVNEYVWRYNHRDDDAAQFRTLIRNAAAPI